MKIIAMILRILIVVIWFKMLSISGWTPDTAPFCSGIGFIALWLYLALQAAFWPKAMLCPIFHGCKSEWTCKK